MIFHDFEARAPFYSSVCLVEPYLKEKEIW